ncbi:MAG: OmpA family protein [Rhodobacteraceae bacterium]|jgi:outer membrane protein OmpA-like peptidoglycan-associated protein|nr:OmpA family protein [Paracoccaceae bacterium]
MRLRTPAILAAVAVIGLAACDPAVMGPENERTRQGAATGAIVGGAIGALTGPRDRALGRAAVGAVIGGAVGAAIGAQLDRQAAELRRDLGPAVEVRNTGESLVVTMPQDILFDTGSALVRADLQRDLQTIAGSLMAYPDSRVEVVGHTDNVGTAAFNLDLSQRRANSVAAVLAGAGVSAGRILAFGRGEDQPRASNLTPEGRAQNRRVEIIIRPVAA